ncbi:MAG TPA: hypothetical protein VHZ55_02130 [Bryobacteraceae bacterium]|jgi:uncharacterized linocin/CFP29 family protein|nr:hypothetical protein [Bryobacteraceae bacterium]
MISGSLCRHLKTAGRFVIEVSSPYQPERLTVATHPVAVRMGKYTLAQHYAETVSKAFEHFRVDESDRDDLAKLQRDIQADTLKAAVR